MLLSTSMNRPEHVWDKTWSILSDGIIYEKEKFLHNIWIVFSHFNIQCTCQFFFFIQSINLQLSEEDIQNLTLIEIETLLRANRKSLKDFGSTPFPNDYTYPPMGNRLMHEELDYDIPILREEFKRLFSSLTGAKSVLIYAAHISQCCDIYTTFFQILFNVCVYKSSFNHMFIQCQILCNSGLCVKPFATICYTWSFNEKQWQQISPSSLFILLHLKWSIHIWNLILNLETFFF